MSDKSAIATKAEAIDRRLETIRDFEADQKSCFGMLAARVAWWTTMVPSSDAVRETATAFEALTRGGRVFASDQEEIGAAIQRRLTVSA